MTAGERQRLAHKPTALYRFYAADGELLYVGITQEPETRWKSHERNKVWWIDVARKEHVVLKTRAEAETLERTAIRTEHPRYDRTRPGHFPTDGRVYKRPLDDPYQEGIVARAENAMKADLVSGVIPSWSVLPTNAVLAKQYKTSKAAIDHVLRRLHMDGLLAPTKAQYINAPRKGFPSRSAYDHGAHYVLAAHHFGFESFSAGDLGPYVPHSLDVVSQNLTRLCKEGLARCVARRPVGQYVLTKMPKPDPVVHPPVTREDVDQMERWLVQQVEEDQQSTSDHGELSRLQRDRAVIDACTAQSPEVLAEMAHFYSGRSGYRDAWKPQRLGGPYKPKF